MFHRCWLKSQLFNIPVVPHKAAAEVWEIGNLYGEVSCCDAWMAERTYWWIQRWLRLWVSLSLSVSLCISLSVCLPLFLYLCIYLSIYLSIHLSICLSVCLSVYLSDWTIYLSVCLSVCLQGRTSARLVAGDRCKTKQFCETSSVLNLTMSQTMQFYETSSFDNIKNATFCETPSIFEFDNVKNEAILQDFLQTWNGACRDDGLVTICFAIFHFSSLKLCGCHEKARSYQ